MLGLQSIGLCSTRRNAPYDGLVNPPPSSSLWRSPISELIRCKILGIGLATIESPQNNDVVIWNGLREGAEMLILPSVRSVTSSFSSMGLNGGSFAKKTGIQRS